GLEPSVRGQGSCSVPVDEISCSQDSVSHVRSAPLSAVPRIRIEPDNLDRPIGTVRHIRSIEADIGVLMRFDAVDQRRRNLSTREGYVRDLQRTRGRDSAMRRPRTPVGGAARVLPGVLSPLLRKDVIAKLDALVADVDLRTGDELPHLL